MTTQAERIEQLRERLLEPDVQVEDVWDYLALQHQPHQGMVMQNLADFVTKEDIANFFWLRNWWEPVLNKPNNLPTPTIMQFCWFINHTPGAPPVTFDMALKQFYERAVNHCKLNDIDPANPGETAEERRKRRNRERMAAVRGHRRVPDKELKGKEALELEVRALEAQCEQLKNAAKVEDEQLRHAVVEHQQAMMAASDKRKAVAADYKSRIEGIRGQILSLTQKT
jgi:hypothetical protein